jgi:hypothetical protein
MRTLPQLAREILSTYGRPNTFGYRVAESHGMTVMQDESGTVALWSHTFSPLNYTRKYMVARYRSDDSPVFPTRVAEEELIVRLHDSFEVAA